MTKEKRLSIVEFVAEHDWSYQLVADHFRLTRNQIAGILFRHRHPYEKRIGKTRNMTGTGRHGPGAMPRFTAQNSR